MADSPSTGNTSAAKGSNLSTTRRTSTRRSSSSDVTRSTQARTLKKVEDDPRFKFGPVPIQTAEDALNAFLREEIDRDEYEAACARFGRDPVELVNPVRPTLERPDAAFNVDIPDDLFFPNASPKDNLDVRKQLVDEKEDLREDAAKQAEKDDTVEKTQKRESNTDFRNKLVTKHLTSPADLPRRKIGEVK